MKIRFPKLLQILILILLPFACSEKEVFSEYHSFKDGNWNKDKACVFAVSVNDPISVHDICLEIRNKEDYPFRNLWLFIDSQSPDGSIRKDTLNFELADVFGKWYGKGLSLHLLSLPLQQNIRFERSGTYTYSIRQGMRVDELKGISDIGFRIVKKTN